MIKNIYFVVTLQLINVTATNRLLSILSTTNNIKNSHIVNISIRHVDTTNDISSRYYKPVNMFNTTLSSDITRHIRRPFSTNTKSYSSISINNTMTIKGVKDGSTTTDDYTKTASHFIRNSNDSSTNRNASTLLRYTRTYIKNRSMTQKTNSRILHNIKNIIPNTTKYINNINIDGRRQNKAQLSRKEKKEKRKEMAKKLGVKVQNIPQDENFWEPYWHSGEWVFKRFTENDYGKTATARPMEIYRGCEFACPNLFKYTGKVCGMRYEFQTWYVENRKLIYKEFDNICAMEYENCNSNRSRPMFVLLQRGPCVELTTLYTYPTAHWNIVSNAKYWAPFQTLPRNWTQKDFAYLYYD